MRWADCRRNSGRRCCSCAEQGLSFRQIAEALDLTEETARWRVFKARQKLLALLAPRQEQEKP